LATTTRWLSSPLRTRGTVPLQRRVTLTTARRVHKGNETSGPKTSETALEIAPRRPSDQFDSIELPVWHGRVVSVERSSRQCGAFKSSVRRIRVVSSGRFGPDGCRSSARTSRRGQRGSLRRGLSSTPGPVQRRRSRTRTRPRRPRR